KPLLQRRLQRGEAAVVGCCVLGRARLLRARQRALRLQPAPRRDRNDRLDQIPQAARDVRRDLRDLVLARAIDLVEHAEHAFPGASAGACFSVAFAACPTANSQTMASASTRKSRATLSCSGRSELSPGVSTTSTRRRTSSG